ncbi:indole-3-glycerol-phosphate synthase, partial [Francisellaceae bacterium]|nr:indole-3-glycerol-phosphate synthase [Francisellaceae bacterium]
AKQYERGGAKALSILTDKKFFGGRFSDIENVKQACSLPVLCKDFIIDVCQVHRARLAGADACLLIVRILSDEQLSLLHQEIENLGMNALVEIFDEQDLKRALKVNPKIIGINNRNLDTLTMNTNNARSLKQLIPEHILTFSLSGAKTPEDIRNTLKEVDGVLVGTALMKAQDPENFLKEV